MEPLQDNQAIYSIEFVLSTLHEDAQPGGGGVTKWGGGQKLTYERSDLN